MSKCQINPVASELYVSLLKHVLFYCSYEQCLCVFMSVFVYCDCLLVCIVLILLNIDIEYELSVWMCYLALIRYLSPSGKIICCKTCVLRVKRLWKEVSSTEFNKKFLLNKSPIHLKWKKSRFKRSSNLFKTKFNSFKTR